MNNNNNTNNELIDTRKRRTDLEDEVDITERDAEGITSRLQMIPDATIMEIEQTTDNTHIGTQTKHINNDTDGTPSSQMQNT